MDILNVIIVAVRDLGLPVAIIIWAMWFITVHAWPEFVDSRVMFATALEAFTRVMDKLVDRLPSQD